MPRSRGPRAGRRAGKSSVAVGTAGGVALALFPESRVLATLQTIRAGLYVQAAVPSVSKNSITIYLNKKAPAITKVAWFILS